MIKGLIAYFARNRIAANLPMVFLIIGGLIAANQLSIQIFPELSFGELKTETGDVVLHTISKRNTDEEFENILLIRNLDGSIIELGDVATITDGFSDYEVYSRLNGDNAAVVQHLSC